MNFYDNFLSLCNNAEKSPSRVLLEIGITKSALTRWKSGGNPTDATARKIADYFGVTADYLHEESIQSCLEMADEICCDAQSITDLFDIVTESFERHNLHSTKEINVFNYLHKILVEHVHRLDILVNLIAEQQKSAPSGAATPGRAEAE